MIPYRTFPWEMKIVCPHCDREMTLELGDDLQTTPFGEEGEAQCQWVACQRVIRFRVVVELTDAKAT